MYSEEEKARIKEIFGTILRPVWKDFCDKIAKMATVWITEFMKKEYRDDLMCMIYAYLINKSGEN